MSLHEESLHEEIDRLAEMLRPASKRDEYKTFQQIGKILELISWKLGEFAPFEPYDKWIEDAPT